MKVYPIQGSFAMITFEELTVPYGLVIPERRSAISTVLYGTGLKKEVTQQTKKTQNLIPLEHLHLIAPVFGLVEEDEEDGGSDSEDEEEKINTSKENLWIQLIEKGMYPMEACQMMAILERVIEPEEHESQNIEELKETWRSYRYFRDDLKLICAVVIPSVLHDIGQDKLGEDGDSEAMKNAHAVDCEIMIDALIRAQIQPLLPTKWKKSVEITLQTKIVEFLCLVRIDATDKYHMDDTLGDMSTVLMMASYNGNIDIIKRLLGSGAFVDDKNSYDVTALMVAADRDRLDIVDSLLKAGANPDCQDNQFKETALIKAAYSGKATIVKRLCSYGADLNLFNEDKDTALICAAERNEEAIVKILIEQKADINFCNERQNTALILAADRNNYTIAHILVNKSVTDVNIANEDGDTALHRAVDRGIKKMVKLLVVAKADLRIKNRDYRTVLSQAKKLALAHKENSAHQDIYAILKKVLASEEVVEPPKIEDHFKIKRQAKPKTLGQQFTDWWLGEPEDETKTNTNDDDDDENDAYIDSN